MKIVSADITGSLIINNVDVTTTVESSSIWSGSIAQRVTNLEGWSSSLDATFATDASVTASILVLSQSVQASQAALSSSYALTSGSYVAVSSSYLTTSASYVAVSSSYLITSASYAVASASLSTRVTTNETNITTLTSASASFAAASGSISSRVTLIEGQYATTGSNNFTGPQNITDTSNAIGFTSTASLYTDGGLRVKGNSFTSGTAYFNDVVVYGTSSIEYITSSQVNIGANIITVNTDTPAVRFGGLSVFDSGSTQLTGSMLWDSERNHWVYSNPSGSSYSGGMIMSGPRNTGSLGDEQGTLSNYVTKGQGGDHITSSQIFDDGTTVRIPGNFQVTGSTILSNTLTGTSAIFNSSVGIGASPLLPLYVKQVSSDGYGFGIRSSTDDTILVIGKRSAGFAISATYDTTGTYQPLSLYTSDTPRLTIATNGAATFSSSVTATAGIFNLNTTNGGFKVTAVAATPANLAYLANNYFAKFYTRPDQNYGITIFDQSEATAIQSADLVNGNNARALILNPYGGNVGIGTNSPAAKLDVNGTGNYSSTLIANSSGGYSNGGSALNVESNSWAIVDANVKRQMQRVIGYVGDYEQHVILLHPVYNGTLIEFNKCTGTIFATRGWTYAGRINDTYQVDTSTGYADFTGALQSNIGLGQLYTCLYNGVKYMALIPQYRTSAVVYHFDGYIANNSGGSTLQIVTYRNSNTGTIVNSEIYNSLTPYTANDTFTNGLLYPRQGIRFASGATTLNYYEEGTFTPTNLGSNMSGVTPIFGRYVRIGNQVTINVRWNVSPGGTGVRYLVFNVPFAFDINNNTNYTGAVSNYNNGLSAYSSNVGTSVRNSSGSDTQQYVEAVFTSNADTTLLFSMTYFTFS